MSQPSNDGFVQLIATGGETSLAWDFKIGQYTDIKITRTRAGVKVTLALNTDYTIAANQLNQSNGGVANLIGTALPALAGDIYTLLLDTPSQRTSDFSQQGAFQAATVNAELDNLVRMTQRLTRDVSKALKYDETLNIPNSVITESIDENFTIVGGATSGSFKEGPSVGDISNAAANATAAAASAATASAASVAAQAANGGIGRVARLATTGNVTLSGLQTIDGVVGAAGDRIFVRGQTTAAQNGIYIMASGAWTRATDANTWSSFVGMLCTITEGSARKNHVYISLVTQGGTLGTTPITFDTVPIDGHITTAKIADGAAILSKLDTTGAVGATLTGQGTGNAPIWQANQNTPRIDVASGATVDLSTLAPNTRNINITGTTNITGFTIAVGQLYFVRFNAALTLTNNASIVTQTGANITTAAGDTCILRATAANTVEVLCYAKASIAATGKTLLAIRTITVSQTPYVPTTGTTAVLMHLIGGGGSGGYPGGVSLAGGGGGGGFAEVYLTSGFTGINLTIGAGGTVPAFNTRGNTGGTTTFGAYSASGGEGGNHAGSISASPWAAGGTASGNVRSIAGCPGMPTSVGHGGASGFGGGGGTPTSAAGNAGTLGGGGAGGNNAAPGAGGQGYAIIYEYA